MPIPKMEGIYANTKNEGVYTPQASVFEDVPLVAFMYLVFTRMPGERYRR